MVRERAPAVNAAGIAKVLPRVLRKCRRVRIRPERPVTSFRSLVKVVRECTTAAFPDSELDGEIMVRAEKYSRKVEIQRVLKNARIQCFSRGGMARRWEDDPLSASDSNSMSGDEMRDSTIAVAHRASPIMYQSQDVHAQEAEYDASVREDKSPATHTTHTGHKDPSVVEVPKPSSRTLDAEQLERIERNKQLAYQRQLQRQQMHTNSQRTTKNDETGVAKDDDEEDEDDPALEVLRELEIQAAKNEVTCQE